MTPICKQPGRQWRKCNAQARPKPSASHDQAARQSDRVPPLSAMSQQLRPVAAGARDRSPELFRPGADNACQRQWASGWAAGRYCKKAWSRAEHCLVQVAARSKHYFDLDLEESQATATVLCSLGLGIDRGGDGGVTKIGQTYHFRLRLAQFFDPDDRS
ncbi:hypothetical protein VTN96DRAFT_3090 [Rasamsonia emersonii]